MARQHITWIKREIGTDIRQYLYVDGVETPFFVCDDRAGQLRYSVHGTGLSKSGSAARFGSYRLISEAKTAAVEMADLDAEPADARAVENQILRVGDRIAIDGGYMFGKRTGTIAGLTTGRLCSILWDGAAHPQTALLALVRPHVDSAHRYTPKYRPPVSTNLPAGLKFELVEAPWDGSWRSDIPRSQHRYGVIQTTQPIPPDQIEHFDLVPLSA